MSHLFAISDIICEGVSNEEIYDSLSRDRHIYIKDDYVYIKNTDSDLIDYLDNAIFDVEDVNNKTLFPILFNFFISDKPIKILKCLPDNFKEYFFNVVGVSFQDLLFYTGKTPQEIKNIITQHFNSYVADLFFTNIQREPLLSLLETNIDHIDHIQYIQLPRCPLSNRLSDLKYLLYSNQNENLISELYNIISNISEFSTNALLELEEILTILESDDNDDIFQIFEDTSKTNLIRLISNILSDEE